MLVQGPAIENPNLLGAEPPRAALAPGESSSFSILGPPSTLIGGYVAVACESTPVPFLRQATRFTPTTFVFDVAPTDPAGRFHRTLQVPNDPGLVGLSVWFHAIGGSSIPVEVAPPFVVNAR